MKGEDKEEINRKIVKKNIFALFFLWVFGTIPTDLTNVIPTLLFFE